MEPIPATWIDAISKLGFPAVLLLAGGYIAWRFGRSLHDTILVPLVTAHINFLQEQTSTSKTMAGAIERQTESIDAIKDSQVEMSRSVRLLAEISHRGERKDGT